MAALGEIPFGRYYGSADATPLFVMLAGAYFERPADREFINQLWPHLLAAIEWMRRFGDTDRDGFVEYARATTGVGPQGWKDSHDSVFHAEGRSPKGRSRSVRYRDRVSGLAQCGDAGAGLAAIATEPCLARSAPCDFARRFEAEFWCDEIGTYRAGDRRERVGAGCARRTPGTACSAGSQRRGARSKSRRSTVEEGMFAGWGIRRWPRRVALQPDVLSQTARSGHTTTRSFAAGLGRCSFTDRAARILSGMLELSQSVDGHRLPELICGFHRRGGESLHALSGRVCASA